MQANPLPTPGSLATLDQTAPVGCLPLPCSWVCCLWSGSNRCSFIPPHDCTFFWGGELRHLGISQAIPVRIFKTERGKVASLLCKGKQEPVKLVRGSYVAASPHLFFRVTCFVFCFLSSHQASWGFSSCIREITQVQHLPLHLPTAGHCIFMLGRAAAAGFVLHSSSRA